MRLHRFYVKQPLGEELVVGSKELLHQWISVFRFKTGDQVLLFSSAPYDFLYQFVSLSKKEVTLSFVSKMHNVEIPKQCTLYMALVKKDTFETVVRQATELGVSTIVPVLATRSEKKNLNFERLEQIAIEAAEQSGRGTVPEIKPIQTIAEALKKGEKKNIVGSLYGKILPEQEASLKSSSCGVWIGPEGGWTSEEEDMFAQKDFLFLKLTNTTLKADTATVSLISLAILH
jgi:16S rRNA (uracil1498-N3)-methyltransferase